LTLYVTPLEAVIMETRVVFVILIVLLFWLAPSPNSSQADGTRRLDSARIVVADDPHIVIKPVAKPALHAK